MSDSRQWQAPDGPPPVPPVPPAPVAPPPPGYTAQPPVSPYAAPAGGYGAPAAGYGPPPGYAPPPKPGLVPLRPMTLGTILSASFQVLRRNPRPTLGPALVISLASVVLTGLVTAGIGVWTTSRVASAESYEDQQALIAGGVLVGALTLLVTALLTGIGTSLLQGIIVAEVARGTLGERLRFRGLWQRLRGRVGALAGWSLMLMAATVLLAAVLFGIVAAAALAGGAAGVIGAVLLALLLGAGALVLWAWLATKLAFVPAAIVLERLPVGASVARSWRLTAGSFWRVFGTILLVMVIVTVATQVVVTPVGLISGLVPILVAPTGDAGAMLAVTIATTLLSFLISAVASAIGLVIQSATTALLYLDLRMRREGLDLELARFVEARQAGTALPDPYLPRDAPTAWPA